MKLACRKCGGMMRLDLDVRECPDLVCFNGCSRLPLDAQGQPLAVVALPPEGKAMEQQIRLMHSQGDSAYRIAQRLHVGVKLVRLVLEEALPKRFGKGSL